jgi:cytochrome c peroxidase
MWRTVTGRVLCLIVASAALQAHALDLVALIAHPPLGLPAVTASASPRAVVDLGRRLFFDRRLSFNGTLSCGMCHVPEQGFTQNELATSVGFAGASLRRNAPALYNVAYRPRLFHDGREGALELQIWSPLLAANEMANPSIGLVVERVAALSDYADAFVRAFRHGPDVDSIGAALAAYERGLLSANAPFDRWRFAADAGAMSPAGVRGFALFTQRGCSACHTQTADTALFSDDLYHDTGVGYRAAMNARPPSQLRLAPGIVVPLASTALASIAAPVANDLGRYEVTLLPSDRWRFRTPTLRNVAVTAPYMHDGSLATLADVIDYYAAGGVPHEGQDPLIKPFALTPGERADLVAFLESLTGDNVAALAADARTAPIGDR